jgi:hypothetical protein
MTKDQLRTALTLAGSHFFDPDTMRFFGSRLCAVLPPARDGRIYFVTSEARPAWNGYASQTPAGPRLYTVHSWNGRSATTETHGAFQQYCSRGAALRAARLLVAR